MKSSLSFLILCVVAAWIPRWNTVEPGKSASDAFPGWNTSPIPAGLPAVSPGERELRFAQGFPGKIGVFTDGGRKYVVRWVRTPTRKLHPASDCLRAVGYTVSPAPIFAQANGTLWGVVNARRGAEQLRVRERIVDPTGAAWTDVSAWFWSAALGRSRGPWWAVTIVEPAHQP